MGDTDQRYNFICPNCSGNFSIHIERIPPVQARFRCPLCKEPMDFPSREEARLYLRLQAERESKPYSVESPAPSTVKETASEAPSPGPSGYTPAVSSAPATSNGGPAEGARFRLEKPGYQSDVYDRRGVRNLIRTREILESDLLRVDDAEPTRAGDLPYLKSLFSMAKEQRGRPPAVCRTHTDRVAHFRCHTSGRPLCEACAPEKKFGGSSIRVCQHCGGTALDLHPVSPA